VGCFEGHKRVVRLSIDLTFLLWNTSAFLSGGQTLCRQKFGKKCRPSWKGGIQRERDRMREDERGAASGITVNTWN
jgi:hypothetical protein